MDFTSYFKKILMLEAMMTDWEAAQIFGFSDGVIPQAGELRKLYLKKITAAHPDHGGNVDDAAKINAAYDILKKRAGSTVRNFGSSWSSGSSYSRSSSSSYSNSSYSSGSSYSNSSNSNRSNDTRDPHLVEVCKGLVDYAKKFDTDIRAEFANKLGSIARELDKKTGYSWNVKFNVKQKLAPQMQAGTAFSRTYYAILNRYIVNAIDASVIFENNDPDNKCKVYCTFKYVFDATTFIKEDKKSKPLFDGDFTYEGTISFQNQSRLLKKEYIVSGKNRRRSAKLNHLKDFDTFFETAKVYTFDEMLSMYFSKENKSSSSNSASSSYSGSKTYDGSSSYSSNDSSSSTNPLQAAVNLIYDNVTSRQALEFDRDIDKQFKDSLQKITKEFSDMTGWKWSSKYYISDTLVGLIRLPSQIGRFLKIIPELKGTVDCDYYYPVDTLIDLINNETNDVITVQTTYWFMITKTNVGDRFKHGLGFRCYYNGQVSYRIDGRQFFYKFRDKEMIFNSNPQSLANLFSINTLLRLGLGQEGTEAKMWNTIKTYFEKKVNADKSTDSSKENASANKKASNEYTKNSSTAQDNMDDDIGLHEQDVFFEELKKYSNKFDTNFSNFLSDGLKRIATALTAKTKYRYNSIISFAPKISDLVKAPNSKKNLFNNAYKTSEGKIKLPLTLYAYGDLVTRDDGSEKRIKVEIRFTFYVTFADLSSYLFGKKCELKVLISLPEASTTYTYFKNFVTHGDINIFDSLDVFFETVNNGNGKKAHADEILDKKYTKASTESNSAQQNNAKEQTTGTGSASNNKTSGPSSSFKDYAKAVDIKNFLETFNGYKIGKNGAAIKYALEIVAPKITSAEQKIISKEKFQGEVLKLSKKLNSIRLVVEYNDAKKSMVFKRFEAIVLDTQYNEPIINSQDVKSKTVSVTPLLVDKLKAFFSANMKEKDINKLAQKFNGLSF